VSGKAMTAGQTYLILEPRGNLFDLRLGELWRARDLIFLLVRRDFVAQFKQTVLGPIWFLLQPVLTTLVFAIVFGKLAGLATDTLPKTLFYMSGTIVWLYFSETLLQAADTFVSNAHLFGKVYFPRLAIPIAAAATGLIRFLLQFALFLGFFLYYRIAGASIRITAGALLFPVLLVMMASLSLGLGIILTSLTAKYRDLRLLLDFGVRLALYATPVIYPLSAVPPRWRWAVLANPLTSIVETFRYGFLGVGSFSWGGLAYTAAACVAAVFVGLVVFNRVEKTFIDTI
jgi:lipopolysaccharide transport system permease protein